jgi:hypothetical protein
MSHRGITRWQRLAIASASGLGFGVFIVLSAKGIHSGAMVLLFAGGLLWGFVLRWPYSLCATILQVGGIYAVSVFEMCKDPTSHNLWPLEFLLYAVVDLIGVLGLLVAWLLKKLSKKSGAGSGPNRSGC